MSSPSTTNLEASKKHETVASEECENTNNSEIPERWVGTVEAVTDDIDDDFTQEWKIMISWEKFKEIVEAWVDGKRAKCTKVQFRIEQKHRATGHMTTWFETDKGAANPEWRSDLA